GRLKGHVTSEAKGVPVADKDCLTKAMTKYDGGEDQTKGCFARLEDKYPAGDETPGLTFGASDALETVVDSFVDAAVHAVDPAFPDVIVNKCSAGKKKCISTQAVGLLKCHQKAETKGIDPNEKGCLDKATAKFDGGVDRTKGCFAKLEKKGDCPTMDDTDALEGQVGAFVADVGARLDPGPTATTSAPGTTTTSTSSGGTTTTQGGTTSTTTSTSATTTTTLGGSVSCTAAGVNARINVPYDTAGAPLMSGIRLLLH